MTKHLKSLFEDNKSFDIRPIAGCIGAEIRGVDLSKPLSGEAFNVIKQAFLDHLVIFLPGQQVLSPSQLIAFAKRFGEVDENPFAFPFKMPAIEGFPEVFNLIKEADSGSINFGGFWHADVTYRERPHKAAVLYGKDVPEYGGDTMFANQYLAYETLTDGMKAMLADMKAVHSSAMPHGREEARFGAVTKERTPTAKDREIESSMAAAEKVAPITNLHPVIRTHPDTGRKFLYVNRAFTERFEHMTIEESLPLLHNLWNHAARPEFTCRYRWSPNAVAVWDNRASQHYAINDYFGQRRHMQRIAVHED